MKLPAYPKYKSSGVEWLGDVPEHWETQGIKFCYTIQLGKMLQPEPASPTDEETPYLKSQHVQWEQVRIEDLPTMWTNKKERRQYAVKDGDLLVCEGGDVGRAAVVRGAPEGTIIQNALHRVRPQGENESGFLLYVLAHAASQGWFEIVCNRSTIAHFTVEKFGALGVAVPTPAEQRAIAVFLDRETGRVDRLVAKKRELIERLKEKRTALISRTVTRGLPPTAARAAGLSTNPPLNPSGVEWLGDIPEHWTTKTIRRVTGQITNGFVGPTRDILRDDGIRYIQSLHVKKQTIKFEMPYFVEKAWSEAHARSILRADDLVIVQTGGCTGEVGIIPQEFDGSNCHALIILKSSKDRGSNRYLLYVMVSEYGRQSLESVQTGALHPHLNSTIICDIRVPSPPLPEQAAIAAYLDLETAKLDALVGKVEEAVERLQEYRTALITAAVTGKIDVRKVAQC